MPHRNKLYKIWHWFKDESNQKAILALSSIIVVICGGAWTLITYVEKQDTSQKLPGNCVISYNGEVTCMGNIIINIEKSNTKDTNQNPNGKEQWVRTDSKLTNTTDSDTIRIPKPKFMVPAEGKVIRHFGPQDGPNGERYINPGISIGGKTGAPVKASADGTVIYVGPNGGYGNIIILKHPFGWSTIYGHLSRFYVHEPDEVKMGDVIAAVGETGLVTSPRLHFEIRYGDQAMDPELLLQPVMNKNGELN